MCLHGAVGLCERTRCCGAGIHRACLRAWVETSLDARCPYCRAALALPSEQLSRLEERRKVVKEADDAETTRQLRLRADCAQQLFDVYTATHRTNPDPDIVWSWCMHAQLKPVTRMLQDFEAWFNEREQERHRIQL